MKCCSCNHESFCHLDLFHIEELPRVHSLEEAQRKYGERWDIIDAMIGKINVLVSEVNSLKRQSNQIIYAKP